MARDGRETTARVALDGLSAGVIVFDKAGHVELANAGAARILARPLANLEGMAIGELLVPVETLIQSASVSRPDPRREIAITLPDGRRADVGFTVTALAAAADHLSFVVLFQEIAAVLQLRRERDRLLQLAAVGDALPSVLHELRNPLAAVTTSLELLLEEPEITHAEDLRAILAEVRRMSLTLQGVGGLVRTARAEKATAIDVAVHDAVRVLEPMARRKGIRLSAVGGEMPLLRLDRELINGVVFNLVKNAIDACDDGDAIEVDAHLESDDMLALSCSDNGPGMSPEVKQRCCELFFTSKEKGSGVGLTLCKRIVEVSGGRIDVDSAEGRGTCITLRFPLETAAVGKSSGVVRRFQTLTPRLPESSRPRIGGGRKES